MFQIYEQTFFGHIVNGALKIKDLKLYKDFIQKLEGKEVELGIREDKEIRSLQFNKWYWVAIVQPIVDFTGYTRGEVHDWHKKHCDTTRYEIVMNGKREELIRSTTTLNNSEFMQFCDEALELDRATFPDMTFQDFETFSGGR